MSVTIARYSEKAGVVLGETRPLKDRLKAVPCRWNGKLLINKVRQGGWIFPWSRLADVEKVVGVLASAAAPAVSSSSLTAAAAAAAAAAAGGDDGGGAAAAADDDAYPVELYSSASGAFIVCGKTYEKKEAYKAAGGVWRSGWAFPASAHDAVLSVMAAAPPLKRNKGGAKKRKREGEGAAGGGGGGGGGEGGVSPCSGE